MLNDLPQTRDDLLLPDHHRQLDRLFDELRDEARGDDARALCRLWSRFESELEAHMRAEEEHLLPAFSKQAPEEVAAIRADHAELRRLVAELGVGVDLHVLRATTADLLIARLRDHARREDRFLYPWAAANLPRGTQLHLTMGTLSALVDGLRVKIHLGGMEARDRLAAIEHEIEELRRNAGESSRHLAEQLRERLFSLGHSLGAGDAD
jgi:hypothetical protein